MNQILQTGNLSLKRRGSGGNLSISLLVTAPFVMPLAAGLIVSALPAAPVHAEYLTTNDLAGLVPLDIGFLIGIVTLFLPRKTATMLALALLGILLNISLAVYAVYWILIRTMPFNG